MKDFLDVQIIKMHLSGSEENFKQFTALVLKLLMKNIGNLFVRLFVVSLLTFRYFSTIVSILGAGAAPFFTAPAPAPSNPFRRLRLRLRLRPKCVSSGGSGSASLVFTFFTWWPEMTLTCIIVIGHWQWYLQSETLSMSIYQLCLRLPSIFC